MRLATVKPPATRLPDLTPQEAARSIAFDLTRAEDELVRGNDNVALVLLGLARSTAQGLASRFAGDRFEIGELVVDVPARQALLRGQPVELSRKAFDLLAVLASDPERVWPRSELYERAWGTTPQRHEPRARRRSETASRLPRPELGPRLGRSRLQAHGPPVPRSGGMRFGDSGASAARRRARQAMVAACPPGRRSAARTRPPVGVSGTWLSHTTGVRSLVPAAPQRAGPERKDHAVAWSDPPTREQLDHLRRLADRKGQSFAWPATRAQASKEIQRLDRAPSSTSAERAVDHREIARDDHPLLSAARALDDEIQGWGSSARWRGASF